MYIVFLLAAIVLFVFLVMKNVPIVVATLASSMFLLVTQQMGIYEGITQTYMGGFGTYVTNYFLVFIMGAIFGKLVEISGAAERIATGIFGILGAKYVVLGLVITGAVLTIGGVNLFVAMFTMYPLAMSLFRKADIPRKFFAGIYMVGCVGFTMTAPFTPAIQNVIPTTYLGTTVAAAALPGLISSACKVILCIAYMQWVINLARKKGEHFIALEGENIMEDVSAGEERKMPHMAVSLLPMIVLLLVLNVAKQPIETALLSGIAAAFICYFKYLPKTMDDVWKETQGSIVSGLTTVSITAAAAGYGAVVAATPAFEKISDLMLGVGGNPLVAAALGTMVMAGVMNSSSGSMAIIVPALGPRFLEMGVNPEALHRIVVVASSTFDSTPQSGFICNLLNYSKTTHRQGYLHVCMVSVVAPILETFLLIAICPLFGLGVA